MFSRHRRQWREGEVDMTEGEQQVKGDCIAPTSVLTDPTTVLALPPLNVSRKEGELCERAPLARDFVIALLLPPSLGRSKVGGQARAGPGRAGLASSCSPVGTWQPPSLRAWLPAFLLWPVKHGCSRATRQYSPSHMSLSLLLSGVSEHAFRMFFLLLSVATKFP